LADHSRDSLLSGRFILRTRYPCSQRMTALAGVANITSASPTIRPESSHRQ
jgi:hypothetical protein